MRTLRRGGSDPFADGRACVRAARVRRAKARMTHGLHARHGCGAHGPHARATGTGTDHTHVLRARARDLLSCPPASDAQDPISVRFWTMAPLYVRRGVIVRACLASLASRHELRGQLTSHFTQQVFYLRVCSFVPSASVDCGEKVTHFARLSARPPLTWPASSPLAATCQASSCLSSTH